MKQFSKLDCFWNEPKIEFTKLDLCLDSSDTDSIKKKKPHTHTWNSSTVYLFLKICYLANFAIKYLSFFEDNFEQYISCITQTVKVQT